MKCIYIIHSDGGPDLIEEEEECWGSKMVNLMGLGFWTLQVRRRGDMERGVIIKVSVKAEGSAGVRGQQVLIQGR